MLDHISFSVSDYTQSLLFYDETFKELGIKRIMDFEKENYKVAAYSDNEEPFFWIRLDSHSPNYLTPQKVVQGCHVAFAAETTEVINKWYQKCLELGCKSFDLPSHRPELHPGYYSASVIDINGYRLEAVLHNYQATQ